MLIFDLDGFHQAADDLTSLGEIGSLQAEANLCSEVLQLPQHQPQFLPLGGTILGCRSLLLQPSQPFAGSRLSRLELVLLQQSLFVGVDQSTDPALHRLDLLLDLAKVDVRFVVAAKAMIELLPQRFGALQQLADVGPHSSVEPVEADRSVRTDLGSSPAKPIHAKTAVVRVRRLIVLREARDPLAIPAIAAASAYEQALQQIAGTSSLLTSMPAVLRELRGDGQEQLGVDQGRNGNWNLILGCSGVARGVAARLFGLPPGRTQPRAATDFAQRQAVAANPLEDLPDDARLFEHHLILSLAATGVFADVTITVRGAAQHIDRTAPGRMTLAAPAAFHDLGPFVLGDHSLHLQQQVFFRADADGAIEEHDLDPTPLQFRHQQHLPGVLAAQAVGRVNVQPGEATGPSHIAQTFEAGAD